MLKYVLSLIFIICALHSYGQGNSNSLKNELIIRYDYSVLWTIDSIDLEFENRVISRGEPLGYIGENYQRFFIHFISIIQNPHNRSEYHVYGKTRVKENICSFQGVLSIDSLILYDRPLIEDITQGYLKGHYDFYEDPNQRGSGELSGNFRTHFYIDRNDQVKYDAIEIYADGYDNNQFEGTWKSYASESIKKCNWGDFRIPDGFNLDIGAAEFSANENYASNGWENFIIASDICCNKNDPAVQKAYALELEEWWKDD